MAESSPPAVSVVFATHNRPDHLEALLKALDAQNLPAEEFEVVAVGNDTDQRSIETLRAWAASGGDNRRAIYRDDSNPASGRNAGWRQARGKLIAFTDDDCQPDEDWISTGLDNWTRAPGRIIQGMTMPDPRQDHLAGPFSRSLEILEFDPAFQCANVFYPRELLERVDGFDEVGYGFGGEDTDLAWRILETGAPYVFDPEAKVYHAVHDLGPLNTLAVATRWEATIKVYADHPELRRMAFTHRIFWRGTHYQLARALLALCVPRNWIAFRIIAAFPYLRDLSRRRSGGGPLYAPFHLLNDLIEVYFVIKGAIRHRVLAL